MDLKSRIPVTPDWPQPGVNFLDIGGILRDPEALRFCTDRLTENIRLRQITAVVAVESRGFPFAAAACVATHTPMYMVRKAGRLPGPCYRYDYTTEYSTDSVEIQAAAQLGDRPLIVDDLLATGGTMLAVANLIRENFAPAVVAAAVVINLDFLPGRQVLRKNQIDLDYIVNYHA